MAMVAISFSAMAKLLAIQYYRTNNIKGINFFKSTKNDTMLFTGMKVRIGENFIQDFQGLE